MDKIAVLYIEDDKAQRESLTGALLDRGFEVSATDSGESGIQAFDPCHHDIVLCDLNLPGMSGLDVLSEIRKRCSDTPLVLLTAHGTISQAVYAVKSGAQHFVLKPVEPDELEITIYQSIELARLRKQLQESEANLRLVMENVPDAIFSISTAGNFLDINRAGEIITGYTADELMEKSPGEIVHPDDMENFEAMIKDILVRKETTDTGTVTFRIMAKDGTIKHIEVNRRVVKGASGKLVRIDGIARDITERVKLQEKVHRYQEQLEQKVEERTERLAYVNRQLKALNDVAQRLSAFTDLESLYKAVPGLLTEALDFDRAALFLREADGPCLKSYNYGSFETEEIRAELEKLRTPGVVYPAAFYRCLESGQTAFLSDLQHDPEWSASLAPGLKADAVAMTPVRVGGVIEGILLANMQFHQRRMDVHDLARFETFSSIIGLTIETIRSYQTLESKVRERTESLREANDELKSKAHQLEDSALQLGKANIELLSVQEQLEEKNRQLEQLLSQLSRSRDELQSILNVSRDPILMVNHEGTIVACNNSTPGFFGLSEERVMAMAFDSFVERVTPCFEDSEAFLQRIRQMSVNTEYLYDFNEDLETLWSDALKLVRPLTKYVNVWSLPVWGRDSEELGRAWMFSDITSLRQAAEHLRSIIDASPIPLVVVRARDERIAYSNSHFGQLLGLTRKELLGLRVSDMASTQESRRSLERELTEGRVVQGREIALKKKDGSVAWCLFSMVMTSVGGESVVIGGLYDISERKRAEDALRRSEERFRGLVENARGIIYTLNPQGEFTYLSPSAAEYTGHDVSEYIGKPFYSLIHPDDVGPARAWMEAGFPDRADDSTVSHNFAEIRVKSNKGGWLWFSSDDKTICDDKGNIVEVLGIAHDVTDIRQAYEELEKANQDLKRAQARLVQSEKMASLGTLVAGIAHEINTPIGAVGSMHNTLMRACRKLREVLGEQYGEDILRNEKVASVLGIIDEANSVIETGTERVTTIVRRLRSFARLDEAELKKVDIHEGLEDTLTLIHHEIKNRIKVVREYGDLPLVACFPGRLNQVFLNLLNNARQAIEGEGVITINTAVVDGSVRIKITDTGRGIAPDQLERVFDPGFTTKGVGVGTGLGLSICYQIMEDHRGSISVESQLGHGSTFTLRLPLNLDLLLAGEEKPKSQQ